MRKFTFSFFLGGGCFALFLFSFFEGFNFCKLEKNYFKYPFLGGDIWMMCWDLFCGWEIIMGVKCCRRVGKDPISNVFVEGRKHLLCIGHLDGEVKIIFQPS